MLFVDGMQINKNGCICQEPWIFTLRILKGVIRNQPCAWRNIGLTKLNVHNFSPANKSNNPKKHYGMAKKTSGV